MHSRLLRTTLAFAILSLGASLVHASDVTGVFKSMDGQDTRMSEYVGKGKWTLVMLWATDCHICSQEAPTISAFHDAHKDRDATVLGLSMDGYEKKAAVQQFVDRHSTTFPNLIGEMTEVALAYESQTQLRLRGTPTFLLYNPDGKLVGQNVGPMRIAALESFIERKSTQ